MSVLLYNNKPLYFMNKLALYGGSAVPPTPPVPTGDITAGWTTITTGYSRPSFDVAYGVGKTIYMTTKQIGGAYVSSYEVNEAFGADQLTLYAPEAGVWNNEWTNSNEYSTYLDMVQSFGYESTEATVGIVTIDFFHRAALRSQMTDGSYDICPVCNGEGNIFETCPTCNGDGQDPGGGYYEECWECGGTGIVDYGDGPFECPSCGGQGGWTHSECPQCGGMGRLWISNCDNCGGDGRVNEVYSVQGLCPFEGGLQYSIQTIPDSPSSFFNYENLQSIDKLFYECTAISGNIIPFITAFSSICPNVSHSQCFYGCTGASDYNLATAQYPDWF